MLQSGTIKDKAFIIPRGPSIVLFPREIWRDFLCLQIFEYPVAFSATTHELPSIRPRMLKHVQLRSGLRGGPSGFRDHVRTLLESTRRAEAKERPGLGNISTLRTANDLCWSNSSFFADAGCRVCIYPVWWMEWLAWPNLDLLGESPDRHRRRIADCKAPSTTTTGDEFTIRGKGRDNMVRVQRTKTTRVLTRGKILRYLGSYRTRSGPKQ